MVARDAGEGEAAAPGGGEPERAAVVDAVERALREEGREGGDRPLALVVAAGGGAEAEHVDEEGPQERPPVVVVAGHDRRRAEGQGGELARAGEERDLALPLAGGEAEVQVEGLEPARLAGRRPHGDPGVLAPPPPHEAHGQVDVPLALDRPAAEGRVAVAALAERHVVADRPVLVAEGAGQLPREVELARARGAVVHLLQHHDVGAVVAEDGDDALRAEAAVDADRAVDVPGDDPQPHVGQHSTPVA